MASDKVILEGIRFYGYHGVKPEERSLGQQFEVDVEIELPLHYAGISDDLESTINYTHVYTLVREVIEGQSRKLIESLAHEIAHRSLSEFPIHGIKVRVTKLRPPILGTVTGIASVEIYRSAT